MKKILLTGVMLLGVTFFSYSQTIEIIGTGVLGQTSANLPLSDLGNIDQVILGATYKEIGYTTPSPTTAQFTDADESSFGTYKTEPDLIVKHFSYPSYGATLGYFETTFSTFDAGGLNLAVEAGSTDKVHGFYAYVYRNDPGATYISYTSPETSYHFLNGSDDPYVYNIPINTASAARNVKVKIPITELDDGLVRKAIIDITAGPVSEHVEVNIYNLGDSFFLGEYILPNVPGNVSEVLVSVYSPDHFSGEDQGDSFFVNGVVADVDKVDDGDPGCTLTWGYWKTHSTCKKKGPKRNDTWDELPNAEETTFFLSGQDYCEVLGTEPGDGGKYYILAHQYIAAQLNQLNGTNSTAISSTFAEATEFFDIYSPQDVDNDSNVQAEAVALGAILDDYNNGLIGPGHCDDGKSMATSETVPTLDREPFSTVNVYPNPMTNYGTISLDSNQKGRTVIELYNNRGMKVDVLYDSSSSMTAKSSRIEFNSSKYKQGNYFLVVRDGNKTHKKHIVIR